MIEYGTLENFALNLDKYLAMEQISYFVIYNRTEVNYGLEEDCDVQWCNDNNIPCYNIERSFGCCVNAAGSINIADIRQSTGEWIATRIMENFVEYLKEKGLNATFDNNDVLIDGYKVASAGAYNIPPEYKVKYSCMQFSLNQDDYVIEHACKNKSKKPAKGLSEWGLTTEEVLNWCLEQFNLF